MDGKTVYECARESATSESRSDNKMRSIEFGDGAAYPNAWSSGYEVYNGARSRAGWLPHSILGHMRSKKVESEKNSGGAELVKAACQDVPHRSAMLKTGTRT